MGKVVNEENFIIYIQSLRNEGVVEIKEWAIICRV